MATSFRYSGLTAPTTSTMGPKDTTTGGCSTRSTSSSTTPTRPGSSPVTTCMITQPTRGGVAPGWSRCSGHPRRTRKPTASPFALNCRLHPRTRTQLHPLPSPITGQIWCRSQLCCPPCPIGARCERTLNGLRRGPKSIKVFVDGPPPRRHARGRHTSARASRWPPAVTTDGPPQQRLRILALTPTLIGLKRQRLAHLVGRRAKRLNQPTPPSHCDHERSRHYRPDHCPPTTTMTTKPGEANDAHRSLRKRIGGGEPRWQCRNPTAGPVTAHVSPRPRARRPSPRIHQKSPDARQLRSGYVGMDLHPDCAHCVAGRSPGDRWHGCQLYLHIYSPVTHPNTTAKRGPLTVFHRPAPHAPRALASSDPPQQPLHVAGARLRLRFVAVFAITLALFSTLVIAACSSGSSDESASSSATTLSSASTSRPATTRTTAPRTTTTSDANRWTGAQQEVVGAYIAAMSAFDHATADPRILTIQRWPRRRWIRC